MKEDRRRNIGGKRTKDTGRGVKTEIYVAGIILIIGIIVFFTTLVIYNKNLDNLYADMETDSLSARIADTESENETEETSSQSGRSVDEMEQEMQVSSVENEEAMLTSTEQENTSEVSQNVTQTENVVNTEPEENPKQVSETVKEENTVKELVFEIPVEGTLMKEYAKEDLVYSETLKEWTSHTGIDIKADKTTVVKSAEDGTVTAIKNDPRYGITVIISHANGYETRYANLLTAEFVKVGENVTKGQTIGTVGNTASFEILDDFHLHFEILKDGAYEDPRTYINI